jgi:hypothetical protein
VKSLFDSTRRTETSRGARRRWTIHRGLILSYQSKKPVPQYFKALRDGTSI